LISYASRLVRQTLRSLLARPGFACVVILSLIFGVAASTATFYAVDRLLVHPIDVDGLSTLVDLSLNRQPDGTIDPISYPGYRSYQDSDLLADLAVVSDIQLTVGGDQAAEQVDGAIVSPNYFDLLGVESELGRGFRPDEAAREVTVLSWSLWHRRFGGDPEILGRIVHLNGQPYTVIGVAPATFRGLRLSDPVALWIPVETFPRVATGFMAQIPVLDDPGIRWLQGVGRLRAGVDRAAAAQGLTRLVQSLDGASRDRRKALTAELTPLKVTALGRENRKKVESLLSLLAILVFFELAITCSNLSGMFFVRGLQRRRESAIRFSLGASRLNLMARLMSEAFLLTLVGTALGLALAKALLAYLGRLNLPNLPVFSEPGNQIGPAHFLFAVAVAVVLALAFSVPATWKLSRFAPAEELKATGIRSGTARFDLRRVLIVAQVAVAVVLLAGTGLFVRSLSKAWQTDPGFRTADVLTAEVNLGPAGYSVPRAAGFFRELRRSLEADPRFEAAAWAANRPLGRGKIELGVQPPGRVGADEKEQIQANVVGPGYFEALGIPMEEGRGFTDEDRADSRKVAVVSATLARRFWPQGEALGEQIVLPGEQGGSFEIVGVAVDVKVESLDEEPVPFFYLPLEQHLGLVALRPMHLLTRTSGRPDAAIPALRSRLKTLDPAVALLTSQNLREAIRERFGTQELGVLVLGVLSLFAVVMVAAGIYGMLASVVAQQRREICVRMALGAEGRQVLGMVIARTLMPVLIGAGIGLATALLVLRLITRLLYGVAPIDLPSFSASLLLILATASLAAYLPARRAARVDPATVLREE